MDDTSATILDYLRARPEATRREVIKALGVSAREVQRAEGLLEEERRATARRRKRLGTLAFGLTLLGGIGAFLWQSSTAPEPPPTSEEAEATEEELYDALDERDRDRVEEARRNLGSSDAGVRLAALRYLATVAPDERLPDLVEDEAPRVRRAAIQLVGSEVSGKQASQALLSVAAAEDRPLEERTLALRGLRGRKVEEPIALARRLLPLLRDERPAVRAQVPSILEDLTGRTVSVESQDPRALHSAWATELQEAS